MSGERENGPADGGIIGDVKINSEFQGINLTFKIDKEKIINSVKNQAIKSGEVRISINGIDTAWRVEVFPKGSDENEKRAENWFTVLMTLVSSSSAVERLHGDLSISVKAKDGDIELNWVEFNYFGDADGDSNCDLLEFCDVELLRSKQKKGEKVGSENEDGRNGYTENIRINADKFYFDGKMEIKIILFVKTTGGMIEKCGKAQKERELKFSNDMRSIANMDQLSDLVLICGDEKIPCHGNVLSARSPVFAAMLANDMKEKQNKEIHVPDSTPTMVRAMIDHIYTGKIAANIGDIASELIHLSEKYELKLLTKACEEALVDELSPENVVKTLVFIDRYIPMSEFRKDILKYIWENLADVTKSDEWEEFLKTYPKLVSDLFQHHVAKDMQP